MGASTSARSKTPRAPKESCAWTAYAALVVRVHVACEAVLVRIVHAGAWRAIATSGEAVAPVHDVGWI